MVSRRATKNKTRKGLSLERATLSAHQILTLNFELCIGCGICEKICPQKAIDRSPPVIREGRLVRKCTVDLDADKCTFCGECVVLCPMNAIKIAADGEEKVPVIENKAFPILVKEIGVEVNKCDPTCNLVCQESCPVKAIRVITEQIEPLGTQKIVAVNVDKQICIFCKQCELACPKEAIHVINPINGYIGVNVNLCPEGCQVCVDICPSKAIRLNEKGKPIITKEACIFCGTCQEVCPEKAINMERTAILHSEIKSGAWNEALEKLTSYKSLVKELSVKCRKKSYARASPIETRAEAPYKT